MHLEELIEIIEKKYAPIIDNLNSEIYGIQYGDPESKKDIKKILFTNDLTIDSIYHALKHKANLIITLNGLFKNPIIKISENLKKKLILLSKFPILIYVLNKSFDYMEGGLLDTLIESLYLQIDKILYEKIGKNKNIPIGRICIINEKGTLKDITLEKLLERIQVNLNMKSVSFLGELDSSIERICVVSENFLNSKVNIIEKTYHKIYDCYISSNFNYQEIIHAKDMGLSLIKIPSYYNEIIALKKLSNCLTLEFPYDEFFVYESSSIFNTYL